MLLKLQKQFMLWYMLQILRIAVLDRKVFEGNYWLKKHRRFALLQKQQTSLNENLHYLNIAFDVKQK